MRPAAPPSSSPRFFRVALWLAIGLGMTVSASAAQEAALAMSVESLPPHELTLGPLKGLFPLTKEQQAALQAQERATLNAIEAMATPRAIVLMLLAGTALVILVSALQIRWLSEAPPVSLARRLGVAAVASAVLRTLAGAQQLVIVRRAAEANAKALLGSGVPDAEAISGLTRALVSVVSVGWTVLVVGLFLGLGSYFRSKRVLAVFVETPPDA